MKLLDQWNCKQNVAGLAFDTTASNTGHKTAACVSLQKKLGRPLLWFACRHHVGEIVLADVWKVLGIEKSSSTKIVLFAKLKENWDGLGGPTFEAKDLLTHQHGENANLIEFYSFFLIEICEV